MNHHKIARLIVCLPFLFTAHANAAPPEAQTESMQKNSQAETAPHSALKFETHFAQATVTEARLNEAISATEKTAQKLIDENTVPGMAIVVVFKDKVVFAKGFGVRKVGSSEKIDADTVFQLASVSKPIASSVVAALVGDGKISWDSKISELDPKFQMYDPWVSRELTIRDLFAHRSGLPDHAGDTLEDIGYDQAQILYRLRYQKPETSFRSKYAYTNLGLTEAALAAAKTYNKSWEIASEEKLYKPLGMNSTSSRHSDFVARSNKALGHVLVDGKWVQKYQRDPDAQSPAGGASSSINDMANWMRFQIAEGKFDGKQIISAEALRETHRPQMVIQYSPLNGLPEFYGLGFNVSYDQSGRLRLSHSGGFSRGAATTISMFPSEQLGICVLTNAYPIGIAEAVAANFNDLALHGKLSQDWISLFKQVFSDPATFGVKQDVGYNKAKVAARPALKSDAYLGKYENDLFGDLQIIQQNGELAFMFEPTQKTFALKHYDGDTFTYEADTENASGTSGLIFSIASDGKAASVLVESLNQDGQGLFKRSISP